jgi:hypothetical protein
MTYKSEWTYVIRQLWQFSDPNAVLADLPFQNVTFSSVINGYGTFQGDVLLSGQNYTQLEEYVTNVFDIFTPGWASLFVLHNGTPVWSGVIWGTDWDSETQKITVNAQEMLSYYDHRRIDTSLNSVYGGTALTYKNQDILYVTKDILDYAEGCSPSGSIGVTYSTSNPTTTGVDVTRTYFNFELKSIFQAWKDLAAGATSGSGTTSTSFFDFVIKPRIDSGNLVNELIVGTPVLGRTYDATVTTPTSTKASFNFQFPGNVSSYKYSQDGSAMSNFLYGLGYGSNTSKLIVSLQTPNILGTSILTSGMPLLQDTVDYSDVQDPDLLKKITAGKLSAIAIPPTTIQITLPTYVDPQYDPVNSYQIGDQVQLTITDDRFPNGFQGIFRIMQIDITPGENGPDDVTLTLNLPVQSNVI